MNIHHLTLLFHPIFLRIVFKIVCNCIVNDKGVPLDMNGSNNTSGSGGNIGNSSVRKCYSGIEYVFNGLKHKTDVAESNVNLHSMEWEEF